MYNVLARLDELVNFLSCKSRARLVDHSFNSLKIRKISYFSVQSGKGWSVELLNKLFWGEQRRG
jgi:hypothetical protein